MSAGVGVRGLGGTFARLGPRRGGAVGGAGRGHEAIWTPVAA